MDYGLEFLELAHGAIQREELELKRLQCEKYSDVTSIWQFEEAWQGYIILKHAIRQHKYPSISCEFACGNKKRADLCFVDNKGAPLAIFELKPGKPNRHLAKCIVRDCEKLRDLTDFPSETQKYVVGIVCESPSTIKAWEETLAENLRNSNVIVKRVAVPQDILSNEGKGKVIRFVMLRVTVAAAMKAGA